VLRNRDASLILWHEGAAQYFGQIFSYDWDTFAKPKLVSEVSTGVAKMPVAA